MDKKDMNKNGSALTSNGWLAACIFTAMFLLFPCIHLRAESFRALVEGSLEVSSERPVGNPVVIGTNGSVLIDLGQDARFIRGIELEITAPQNWLQFRGSIAMTIYNNINPKTASGTVDFFGRRFVNEPLPPRLRIIYQIPIRAGHGLRATTTTAVTGFVSPDAFPLLFRLMPVDKGLPPAFDQIRFNVNARPILSGEGAIRIIPRFPPQLRNRPFTVLINDNVISNISEEIVLMEGEHHLVILSDDYRNESRRFIVERARIIDLTIDLQDPTPLIIFESPQNVLIFLNNVLVLETREPIAIEPGTHEIRFQMGDYTIIRSLNVQRGKTYRVALDIDINIQEED